jgi:hypothetical protein
LEDFLRLGTVLAYRFAKAAANSPSAIRLSGECVMKQICYLFWLAGMATLVAYGWSDNIMNQVSEAVRFVGQLVAFVIV